jgi:phosphatidate cytidylyltransferase
MSSTQKVLYAAAMASVACACNFFGGIALVFLCTFTTLLAYLEWYAISFLASTRHLYVPTAFGYACLTLLPIGVFRLHAHGSLLPVFLIVWCTDIGALLGGKILGGPKLWPAISPNKTVLGLICGILCGTFISRAVFETFAGSGGGGGGVAINGFGLRETLSLAIVAQLGDLAESACKRQAGIKDSNLPDLAIPGHGGILDRLDAMIFTVPLAWAFIR